MKNKSSKTIVRIALAVVVIAVCSWTAIPFAIPFTLQTFAVFLTLILLGGKRGTAAITIYVISGVVGVPVFSGFKSGIAAIAGPTGGYIFGFILSGLTFWVFPKKDKLSLIFLACLAGLAVCYLCGSVWFWLVASGGSGAEGLIHAFSVCVLPYIAVDVIKIILAETVALRLKKMIDA